MSHDAALARPAPDLIVDARQRLAAAHLVLRKLRGPGGANVEADVADAWATLNRMPDVIRHLDPAGADSREFHTWDRTVRCRAWQATERCVVETAAGSAILEPGEWFAVDGSGAFFVMDDATFQAGGTARRFDEEPT